MTGIADSSATFQDNFSNVTCQFKYKFGKFTKLCNSTSQEIKLKTTYWKCIYQKDIIPLLLSEEVVKIHLVKFTHMQHVISLKYPGRKETIRD